jgi:hypothetical protein
MRIAPIAGIALWGIFCSAAAAQPESPPPAAPQQGCKLALLASIDVTVDGSRLLVPAAFGDTPEMLELHFEDAQNILTAGLVDKLGIPTRQLPTNMLIERDGKQLARAAYPASFHFAGVEMKTAQFLVLPSSITKPGQTGSVGLGQFANVDFELDLAHGKLNLFDPNHCTGQVVYWTTSPAARVPYVRNKFGGINLLLMLDGHQVQTRLSDKPYALMGMNIARNVLGLEDYARGMSEVPEGTLPPLPGDERTRYFTYPFKTLSADGLTINNPQIYIADDPHEGPCLPPPPSDTHVATLGAVKPSDLPCNGFELSLPTTMLKKLRLYFARKENMVYVTAADAQ